MMSEASSASHEDLFQEAEAYFEVAARRKWAIAGLTATAQMTPDQVNFLEGGVDAVTYLVKRPDGDVVNLNRDGLALRPGPCCGAKFPATAPNSRQICSSRFQSIAGGLVSTAVV